MNLLPLRVFPGSDLYVDLVDVATARHGIIVTDAAKFHEFVKEVRAQAVKEAENRVVIVAAPSMAEYRALKEAYEEETGRKWKWVAGVEAVQP